MVLPRKLLAYLAGDAFCGAAFSAFAIAIFSRFPDLPEDHGQEEGADETVAALGSRIWIPE